MMIKGIDISHHQGTPDFATAKASGVAFAYLKATEGVGYRDPLYQPNAYNAMKAGLPIGFYHFARPDSGNKPEDEAQDFVDAISVFNYNLIPVLDLEVEFKGDLYNWAKTFVDIVKSKTGQNVMFYTNLDYLTDKDKHPELLKLASECPLWLAAYRDAAPSIPGWDWIMWQYSENENVPGVGLCDCSYVQDLNVIMIGGGTVQYVEVNSLPLYVGTKGDLVRKVQARLGLPADGLFGPRTEQAVKDFQKTYGLVVDGIVGQQTWDALFPPMYRVTVDGKPVIDSAYVDKILSAVQSALNLKNKPKKIVIEEL